MTLQDTFRAENLGRCFEDEATLARLDGQDLSAAYAQDSGCNMLMVYLLNRWGRLYSAGATDELEYSEDFHTRVIDAYLAAGCDPTEEVAPVKIYEHTPMAFRMQLDPVIQRLDDRARLSAASFMQLLVDDYPADANPELHAQMQRVAQRLDTHD